MLERMKDMWRVALGSAWAAPAETGRGLGGCLPRDTQQFSWQVEWMRPGSSWSCDSAQGRGGFGPCE